MSPIKFLVMNWKKCSVCLPLALLLVSCGGGGGGGGGTPPPTNNLSATNLAVNTPNPEAGHPLDVSLTLNANEPMENVGVSLYAVEKTNEPDAVPRQYPIGSQAIEKVEAGTNVIPMQFNIPSNIDLSGQFYLTMVVDPAGVNNETDKEDNNASAEITLVSTPGPNVKLVQLALDRSAMLIRTTDYATEVNLLDGNGYNSDAGGTITVAADGLPAGQTIDIEAFAKLRIHRTDNGATYDVPLYLWNTAVDRYNYAYGVDPTGATTVSQEWLPVGTFNPLLMTNVGDEAIVEDQDRNFAHLEFYVPGKLGQVLEIAARHYEILNSPGNGPYVPPPDLNATVVVELTRFLNGLPYDASNPDPYDETAAMAALEFSICASIQPVGLQNLTSDDALDNESCSPIAVTLPPRPVSSPVVTLPPSFIPDLGSTAQLVTPKPVKNGFATKSGGKWFAFGLDIGNTTMADNHGYVQEAHGRVPMTVFGFPIEFVNMNSHAQLIPAAFDGKPAGESSHLTTEIRFLGQILLSSNRTPDDGGVSFEPYSYSKAFKSKEVTFMVGPVPMSVGGDVTGNFGIELKGLNFTEEAPGEENYQLGSSIEPYINLEARAYGGVGSTIGGFIAGVEGILRLFEERIVFFDGVRIKPVRNTYPSEFVIRRGPKISNVFTGPQGFINLFAIYTVPGIKTCKYGFIRYPCPTFKQQKSTYNLYTTKALFRRSDVLYQKDNLVLDVVIPFGAEPSYYTP